MCAVSSCVVGSQIFAQKAPKYVQSLSMTDVTTSYRVNSAPVVRQLGKGWRRVRAELREKISGPVLVCAIATQRQLFGYLQPTEPERFAWKEIRAIILFFCIGDNIKGGDMHVLYVVLQQSIKINRYVL